MKKIIILTIVFGFTFLLSNCEAEADYVEYTYKGKTVEIFVPENIEYLEWQVMNGELTEGYYFKLVYLQVLLIKHGLKPIY